MTLSELQKRLKKFKLDAFLISRGNIFLGQDIRDDENIIMQLTGFSGSAGTLLIMPQENILFVDGRYELQAPRQVDGNQVRVICTKDISVAQWINQNLRDKKVGYNPWCWSIKEIMRFSAVKMTADDTFLSLIATPCPAKVFEHDIRFCGASREEKVAALAKEIEENGLQAYFISAADSVSWLLNLRSDALGETPVFRAFALIDKNRHVWIFADNIDYSRVNAKLNFLPLADIPARLKKFKKQTVGADFSHTAAAVWSLTDSLHIELIDKPDFCQRHKAVKNSCELSGIRAAHIRDGVAMCKFLCWLDENWQGKTELDIVAKLHKFRAAQENFVSESFATIAAAGTNGAIVHYSPTPETNTPLQSGNFLLLDSGAQYLDGTTDITRTIALGNISPAMSEDFTMVLKAHIHLSSAVFPQNTSGARLDVLARDIMWRSGKDYNHGTGHGVGCFLNVHEGPQYISSVCNLPFSAGQITSVEPGYYLENHYGIRIENLVEVCNAAYSGFLCFKNLTFVPIDSRALNKYLMSDEEIAWLNDYHRQVFETVSPFLTAAEKEWLQNACAPL